MTKIRSKISKVCKGITVIRMNFVILVRIENEARSCKS